MDVQTPKDSDFTRLHFYVNTEPNSQDFQVPLSNGKFLTRSKRRFGLQDWISNKQMQSFLFIECLNYLNIKIENEKDWYEQIYNFNCGVFGKVDCSSPFYIQPTLKNVHNINKFEDVGFIKHLNKVIGPKCEILLSNQIYYIHVLISSSKHFNCYIALTPSLFDYINYQYTSNLIKG